MQVIRRMVAVHATQRNLPSVVLDREQEGATPALGVGAMDNPPPLARGAGRDIENGSSITDVDTDLGLGGSWQAEFVKGIECKIAARRSIDDDISVKPTWLAVRLVMIHAADRRFVSRMRQTPHATLWKQRNIALPFDQASSDRFDERPGHAERVESEVAARPRIETGRFHQNIDSSSRPDRASKLKLRLEFGKELQQGVQPGFEQRMGLPAMRGAGPRFRPGGQKVALQHRDFFEMCGQSLRRGEAGDSCSDDNGMLAQWTGHAAPLKMWTSDAEASCGKDR